MLISNLCDYRDAFIVVKRIRNVRATANTDEDEKNVAFKNNGPFRSCITKINRTLIENAEDLHIVIPIYNLLEYSQIYSTTSENLWKLIRNRDEIDDADDNASNSKSFKYNQ